MPQQGDPRVYFAAERTLLAWVRTGLAVIGMGFVVARFGLSLRALRHEPDTGTDHASTWIGVGLLVLGSAALVLASRQHLVFCKALPPEDIPAGHEARWSVGFALLLALVGVGLIVYLLARSASASL